jgi:O-antigen ligase
MPKATLGWGDKLLATLIVATLFIAVLCVGSDRNDFALYAGSALSAELIALVVIARTTRKRPPLLEPLLWPGVLYALVLAAALWSLTPYGPGGAHPIWAYVPGTAAITINKTATFIGLLKLGGLGAAFTIGWFYCSEPLKARLLFRAFVYAMAVYAAWALLMRSNPQLASGAFKSFQGDRLAGSFQSANIAGTWFGIGFILALSNFLDRLKGLPDRTNATMVAVVAGDFIVALLIGTCLMLTVSRGAVAATIIALALFIVLELFAKNWRVASKQKYMISALGLLGFIVLAWSAGVLVSRYSNSLEDWTGHRQIIFETHWSAFLASPWFGYGLGTFNEINKLQETALNFPVLWNIRAAHNVYLQWLEQAGIAGAAPMFACIVFLVASLFFAAFQQRRLTTWLRGLGAASVLILIHSWSDFALEIPALSLTWALLLGSGYAVACRTQFGGRSSARSPDNNGAERRQLGAVLMTLFGTIGAVLALTSGTTAIELDSPRYLSSLPLPLASVYGAQANNYLTATTQSSDALAKSKELTERELALSPASASGWLRLAYIVEQQGRKTAEISQMLERSYAVAPMDPETFDVRMRFAFENWTKLDAQTKNDVLEQVRNSWQVWRQRDQLNELLSQIRSPTGRLALYLLIDNLRR